MAFGIVNTPGGGGNTDELKALAQEAKIAATAAQETAEAAKTTADTALETANEGKEAATDADTKATEALTAAQGAAESSDLSAAAAQAAREAAAAALAQAQAAAQAATNAQTAADAALESVTKLTSTISTPPSQNGSLYYTGAAQTPAWNSYDPEKLTIGGDYSGVDVGEYTATFTPKEGYAWADETTTAKSVTWRILRASVATPAQSGSLTYTGEAQSPTFSGYDSAKMTMGGTTTGTNAGSYNATFTPTANYQWSDGTTTAKTVAWSIGKAAGSLTLNKTALTLDGANATGEVTVTRAGDGAISALSSNASIASVAVANGKVTVTGKTNGTVTVTVKVAAGTNHTAPEDKTFTVTVDIPNIYGASWDGTSTTKWTRTDGAARFTDPVPYVAGASSYSSPFDNIQPWAGMVKSNRAGGVMVAIPKFWYKLTQSGAGMKIQIADKATAGFSVSPAHMDRGDGKGERAVVYIGRYHCASDYKSKTGVAPEASITRSAARSGIHALGTDIWQVDFALRFTIWLLYIVEFADWNTQKTIGKGCGNNSAPQNMGYTDSMPYHTGTTQNSRDTYGLGTQYRYIEGLWDNVYDWCDGCYNASNGLNIILNPNNFSDSSGGTTVGTPTNGWPSAFSVKTAAGFPMFIPTATAGSETTYSCDYWAFSASSPCVCVGGNYGQGGSDGLFFVNYSGVSHASAGIGSRLQELP